MHWKGLGKRKSIYSIHISVRAASEYKIYEQMQGRMSGLAYTDCHEYWVILWYSIPNYSFFNYNLPVHCPVRIYSVFLVFFAGRFHSRMFLFCLLLQSAQLSTTVGSWSDSCSLRPWRTLWLTDGGSWFHWLINPALGDTYSNSWACIVQCEK